MPKEEMLGPDVGGDIGFTPIMSQEEFDKRIKARLAREREKWEKSGEVASLGSASPLSRASLRPPRRRHRRSVPSGLMSASRP
jgi:hypothetical protein